MPSLMFVSKAGAYPRAKCYQSIMAVIYNGRLFVPGKPFQLSLMFGSETGAYPSSKLSQINIFNIKRSWYKLVRTRRSTVLNLPLKQDFPDSSLFVLSTNKSFLILTTGNLPTPSRGKAPTPTKKPLPEIRAAGRRTCLRRSSKIKNRRTCPNPGRRATPGARAATAATLKTAENRGSGRWGRRRRRRPSTWCPPYKTSSLFFSD